MAFGEHCTDSTGVHYRAPDRADHRCGSCVPLGAGPTTLDSVCIALPTPAFDADVAHPFAQLSTAVPERATERRASASGCAPATCAPQ